MPADFLKVTGIGRLTRDPDLRYGDKGGAYVLFGLAVNVRDRNGDELPIYLDAIAGDAYAENINKYLAQGSQVYFEGYLSTHDYEGKDGNKTALDASIVMVKFLGDPKNKNGSGNGGRQQDDDAGQRQPGRRNNGAAAHNSAGRNGNGAGSRSGGGRRDRSAF